MITRKNVCISQLLALLMVRCNFFLIDVRFVSSFSSFSNCKSPIHQQSSSLTTPYCYYGTKATTLLHGVSNFDNKNERRRRNKYRQTNTSPSELFMSPGPSSSNTTQSSQKLEESNSNDNDDDAGENVVTYFSPNVRLDETRYRYDLEDDYDDKQDLSEGNILDDVDDNTINEYSFFDEAIIYVRAGSGGQGSSTYKKGAGGQNGPPDGGNGGKGGNVILQVDESLNTLAGLTNAWRPNSFGGSGAAIVGNQQQYQPRPKSFRAENGHDGERQFKNGRYGKDVIVRVPPGTVVQEQIELENDDDDEMYSINDNNGESGAKENNKRKKKKTVRLIDLGSLTIENPTLTVVRGGEGGEGSGVSGKIGGRGVRRPRVPPEGGERKKIKLTLKVVADVALVGVPNAGKSTFLASVTRAKPKIANYPFTTVIPNLGVWIPPEENYSNKGSYDTKASSSGGAGSSGLVLCDVPGLIAGAAKGVGLGHAFLRHVERCHVILHLVDATSIDPIADFNMLNREILKYGNGQLAKMPQIVVVNKMDVFDDDEGINNKKSSKEQWEDGLQTKLSKDELEEKLKSVMTHTRLLWMSAKEKDGVDELMARMSSFVKKVKETETT